MRILATGKGTSGSWRIRGDQLGAAIGATVAPMATDAQIKVADLVVLVKRAPEELLARLRRSGKRIVLDVVDCWPQPDGNVWNGPQVIGWLHAQIKHIRPHAIVTATERMRSDLAFTGPSLALPHHARPGAQINPIREQVQTVGYEGDERYLGACRRVLEDECAARGWRFVVNPPQLADLDIVVALREGIWTGYAPRHWKSNVKLANAQATGTPCILSPECGYEETATGAEYWATTRADLRTALDWLTPHENRLEVSKRLLRAPVGIDTIAATYRSWLESLA